MGEESDFVAVLLSKLRADQRAEGRPDTCVYDASTRTAALTFRRPDGSSREVRLELPADGVQHFLDSLSEQDIRFVWGPGVDRVEAAARFAAINLEERVATTDDDPLVIRYRVAT
jgi:hypothetical protein